MDLGADQEQELNLLLIDLKELKLDMLIILTG